jgi:GDP-L-fucose synthase
VVFSMNDVGLGKDVNMKIFIAGHRGMVGSAIHRALEYKGYHNLITRGRQQLDLCNQRDVDEFIASEKPDYIFIAAARVGGIHANNTYRADFIYENLMIEANLINSAARHGVNRLMFLGSNCIYPRNCSQPMKEEHLLTGPLEYTNEPYAIAKIAGIKLCESYNAQYGTKFVSVMPANLFGPNDNYDLLNCHVIPALIIKTHEAKINSFDEINVWGTGSPKREFLYVDDLADACVELMESRVEDGVFNVGKGEDVTIKELVSMIADVVGFKGSIVFDTSKPDGSPRKLLGVSKINEIGWSPKTDLRDGIKLAYQDYLDNQMKQV